MQTPEHQNIVVIPDDLVVFHGLSEREISQMKQQVKAAVLPFRETKRDDPALLLMENENQRKLLKMMGSIEISPLPRLTLNIAKTYILKLKEPGRREEEGIGIKLFQGEGNLLSNKPAAVSQDIGVYYLSLRNNSWQLKHRFVEPMFRHQGFGSVLLAAAESFVEEFAKQCGEKQKISINSGQDSVIRMAIKKGYRPETAADEKIYQRIISDPTLIKVHARQEIDGVLTVETHKDVYIYDPATTEKNEENALRVTLIKIFPLRN